VTQHKEHDYVDPTAPIVPHLLGQNNLFHFFLFLQARRNSVRTAEIN
jgi:hypothetical protein